MISRGLNAINNTLMPTFLLRVKLLEYKCLYFWITLAMLLSWPKSLTRGSFCVHTQLCKRFAFLGVEHQALYDTLVLQKPPDLYETSTMQLVDAELRFPEKLSFVCGHFVDMVFQ